MDILVDVVRLGNAVLASFVFGALVYKGWLFYHTYNPHQKLLFLAFTGYALGLSYGSVEAYGQDAPFGVRVPLFLIANILAVVAFVRYRDSAFGPQV